MGDIAFLLIIFFMVVSNFFKTPKIDADMPGWKILETLTDAPIGIGVDKESIIFVNRDEVTSSDDVKAAVETAVANYRGEDQLKVPVRIHKELTKDVFEPIIEAVNAAGATPVLIAEEDK